MCLLHRTRLRQAFGTREDRFGGSNLSSLRRALRQSAVVADAHRRPRTEDKGANVNVAQRSAESSDKRASFRVTYSGHQFCGPGTRLTKRLARGDEGINPLDAACREHDITYSRSNDLVDKALGRVTARDSALSERAAAAAVWAAKVKTKIGMGMKSKKKTR